MRSVDRLQARREDRRKLEIIEPRIRAVVRKRSNVSLDLGVMGRSVDGWCRAVRVGRQLWTDEDEFLTILNEAQLKTILQHRDAVRPAADRHKPPNERTSRVRQGAE